MRQRERRAGIRGSGRRQHHGQGARRRGRVSASAGRASVGLSPGCRSRVGGWGAPGGGGAVTPVGAGGSTRIEGGGGGEIGDGGVEPGGGRWRRPESGWTS